MYYIHVFVMVIINYVQSGKLFLFCVLNDVMCLHRNLLFFSPHFILISVTCLLWKAKTASSSVIKSQLTNCSYITSDDVNGIVDVLEVMCMAEIVNIHPLLATWCVREAMCHQKRFASLIISWNRPSNLRNKFRWRFSYIEIFAWWLIFSRNSTLCLSKRNALIGYSFEFI